MPLNTNTVSNVIQSMLMCGLPSAMRVKPLHITTTMTVFVVRLLKCKVNEKGVECFDGGAEPKRHRNLGEEANGKDAVLLPSVSVVKPRSRQKPDHHLQSILSSILNDIHVKCRGL